MPKNISTLFCERAIIDEVTKKVTLIDIFENVTISKKQFESKEENWSFINLPFCIVILVTRTMPDKSEKGKIRFSFVGPSGKRFNQTQELPFDLGSYKTFRGILNANLLPYENEGDHFCIVEFKSNRWNLISKYPYTVLIK